MARATFLISIGLAGAVALAAAPVLAADLTAPPAAFAAPASEPMLEWGSGWYLRGDIGYNKDNNVRLTPLDGDNKRNGWIASLGAGYQLNNFFRVDATLEHFNNRTRDQQSNPFVCPYAARGADQTFTDATGAQTTVHMGHFWDDRETCTISGRRRLGVTGGMLNAYFDLGGFGPVTPYVGAGIGLFRHQTSVLTRAYKTSDGSHYEADLSALSGYPLVWYTPFGQQVQPQPNVAFTKQNLDVRAFKNSWRIGWALMAGVAVDVAKDVKLDISYRYLNAGSYKPVVAGLKEQNLNNHQVRVGVRYMLDN